MPGREVLRIRHLEQNIFVQIQSARARCRQLDGTRASEALQLVRLHLDRAQLSALCIGDGHLVVEIILTRQPDRHRTELHVDVLRDEKSGRRLLLLQSQRGSNDPVIHAVLVRKNFYEPFHACRLTAFLEEIVHQHPHCPATGGRSAARDTYGIMAKNPAQKPMRLACVGAALALLILEIVQLGEHIHRNENVVVLKPVQTIRVVQKNIRVQNKVLHSTRRTGAVGRCQLGKENALLLGEFRRFGSVHIWWVEKRSIHPRSRRCHHVRGS